jgi:O-antigen/teichoic acid export membrane protein
MLLKTPLGRIVHMSAAFAVSNLMRSALGFVTSLVVARGLGRDGFGGWTFCMAWAAALTTVFDLGISELLTRDTARGDHHTGRLLTDALVTRLVLFVPAGVVVYVAAPRLGLGLESPATLRIAVWLAAAGLAYGCVAAVFRAWPHRLIAILVIETGGAGAQCLGAVWIAHRGGGIAKFLLLATAVQVVQLVLALVLWWVLVSRPDNDADDAINWPSWHSTASLLRRAFPFAMLGLVANAQTRMAPLLLGYLSIPAEIASFGVATRLASLATLLPYAGFTAALPVFSHEAGRGNSEGVRSRFEGVLRGFTFAAAAVLVVCAAPIVRMTYGARFAAAASPLVWMGVGLVPSLANSGHKVYLYATGRERIALRWSAVALVVQAIGCALLVPRFGAPGAAVGLAIGEAAVWLPLRMAVT